MRALGASAAGWFTRTRCAARACGSSGYGRWSEKEAKHEREGLHTNPFVRAALVAASL